ncbi:hypothetical protein Clacol_002090 [Clathrus columnatus]|uniref:Uncharacterized protein n=1 Tax=Clathrus columnatus TaxID=1419009 RepID=A0AAV5A549_9AGAM|nr:hypothetical protein Clacol_002090 [Clathrus columnatus]
MASENRIIVVENNDPSITYVGQWTTVQTNTINNFDIPGLIFSPTLQSTEKNGSSIFVLGTFNTTLGAGNNDLPSWECLIDGISLSLGSMSAPQSIPIIGPGWSCGRNDIPDGPHELTVNSISDGVTPFYVEYLTYSPSPNVSRENSLIAIDSTDPAIDYISGWNNLAGYNQTTDPNGLVNVTFVGIQLSWYGYLSEGPNATVSSGEYSIDGKPFTSFQIPVRGTAFPLLFITQSLEMGTHVLSVRYTGTEGQLGTPLILLYLIVMNGSFSSTLPMISGGDSNKTGTMPDDGPQKGPSKARSIIGEALGPILGVTIAIAILLIYSKYHRKQKQRQPPSNIMPFYMEDSHSTLPVEEIREIPKNLTHLPSNLNIDTNNIEVIEHSDSDSIVTNPFHTPIRTSFQSNNLPSATNVRSNRNPSQQMLPEILVDPTSPIVATGVQHNRRRPSLSNMSWRVNDSPGPPSYTTEP